MKKPDMLDSFMFDGKVNVEWFDILNKKDIPDIEWQQVYIIGNLDGKIPLVIYQDKGDNLPGGGTEAGESIQDTAEREAEEELNMRLTSWEPIGYQKLSRADRSEEAYQFRIYATLEKIGEFENDPGGSVIGNKLIEPEKLNDYINYGKVGDHIVKLTRQYFK